MIRQCIRFEHCMIMMYAAGFYVAIAAQILHTDGKAYQAAGVLMAFAACFITLVRFTRRMG